MTKESRHKRESSLTAPSDATLRNTWYSSSDSDELEKASQPGALQTITSSGESNSGPSWRGADDVEKQNGADNQEKGNEGKEKIPNIVDWDGDGDAENPMNWPVWRKLVITITLGVITFVITFASSVWSTTTIVTSKHFGVSPVVMTLGVSLFVLGFAFGPLVFGPLSELYGRKKPLLIGYFISAIFALPVALAQNLWTIMICRFFGGFFGSSALAIVGGEIADMWGPLDRGIALAIFASATFVGPVCGPVIGSFVTQSYLGWRWTSYLNAILGLSFGIIALFVVPETYTPTLMRARAEKRRHKEKNWALHAKAEEEEISMRTIVEKYLFRPFAMMSMEPILLLVTLYMSLIYGIIYLFFEAYPIAFTEQRKWTPAIGSLPFIAFMIGVLSGVGFIIVFTKTRIKSVMDKNGGQLPPEERMVPMMVGAILFPIGLFWFAFTSNPHITWVPQVLAGVPIGFGAVTIFQQGITYIVDVYLINANSAIAANAFVRSLVGAGFPMFAVAMYHTLGVQWATALLGFLTALLVPVPFLFYKYGERIRKWSKYVP